MYCLNCGNTNWFVLVVELTVLARHPSRFREPDWGLAIECADCASTDVAGDPVWLLAARVG